MTLSDDDGGSDVAEAGVIVTGIAEDTESSGLVEAPVLGQRLAAHRRRDRGCVPRHRRCRVERVLRGGRGLERGGGPRRAIARAVSEQSRPSDGRTAGRVAAVRQRSGGARCAAPTRWRWRARPSRSDARGQTILDPTSTPADLLELEHDLARVLHVETRLTFSVLMRTWFVVPPTRTLMDPAPSVGGPSQAPGVPLSVDRTVRCWSGCVQSKLHS